MALASIISEAHWKTELPGRMTIITPVKPITTEARRTTVMRSPSNGQARKVTASGETKEMAIASVTPTYFAALKKKTVERSRPAEQIACCTVRAGAQQRQAAARQEDDAHQHEMHGEPDPHDLLEGIEAGQQLHDGVLTGNSAQATHMKRMPSQGRDERPGGAIAAIADCQPMKRSRAPSSRVPAVEITISEAAIGGEAADLPRPAVADDQPVRHHRCHANGREGDGHAHRDGDDADDPGPQHAQRKRQQDQDQRAGAGRNAGRRQKQPSGQRALRRMRVMVVVGVIVIVVAVLV